MIHNLSQSSINLKNKHIIVHNTTIKLILYPTADKIKPEPQICSSAKM